MSSNQQRQPPRPLKRRFTDDQMQTCHDAFCLFDKDSDGRITTEELYTVLRSLGQDPDEDKACSMIKYLDKNGNGCVEFNEFLAVMTKLDEAKDTEDDLVQIFQVIDQDGDGYISKSDIREVAESLDMDLSSQELDEMIREVDKDGDGLVTFEEFTLILQSKV